MKKRTHFLKEIKEISNKTKKKKLWILKDMIKCHLKYKANTEDYVLTKMVNMNSFERKTVLTKGKNKEIQRKYNNPKYIIEINDKEHFYKNFDKYLNFDWLKINEENEKEWKKFIKNHPNIEYIQKSKTKKRIDVAKNSYEELKKQDIEFVIEKVESFSVFKRIQEEKESRITIITFLGTVASANLEIGDYNKDGLIAPIDIETGSISHPAVNKAGKIFDTFIYLKIPKWENIIDLCEEASLEIPAVGYIEWTICVGTTKCYLLKGSSSPNYNHYQLPEHRNSNIGVLPLYKQIEERKIEQ